MNNRNEIDCVSVEGGPVLNISMPAFDDDAIYEQLIRTEFISVTLW